jgi:hypothetical protein
MHNNILSNIFKISIVLLGSLCLSQVVNAADNDSTITYEAENMTLKNYVVEPNSEAYNDSLITLESDYGSATINPTQFSGNYDLHLTYILEEEGNCVFEIYIDDELVDSWLSNQYEGAYSNDSLNRVVHVSQNIALNSSCSIEVVGYTSEGEYGKIDRLEIVETAVSDSLCNLTWSTDGSISSLLLGGSEQLNSSSTSGLELVVFLGVKLTTSSADMIEENNQNVQLIEESSYSERSFSFRVERFEHHIRLRLLNMEGIPKRDKSIALKLTIPYSSDLSYVVLDDQIEVDDDSNTLTVYWTELASRDIIPGGYIAIYADSEETEALAEINYIEELEVPVLPTEPTDIFLSTYKFSENNEIGDNIAILTAEDPQDDIMSYALVTGDGDTDNDKFIVEGDSLIANSVFDYEAGSLVYIRVQVSDSVFNTYEKSFILALVDDESDSETGIQGVELQNVNVYPNPTNSLLYISGDEDCLIEICNVVGTQFYSGWHNTTTIVNMEKYVDGLYIVKLSNEDGVVTKKIIKQK